MLKTFKYRLYPNLKQTNRLQEHLNQKRYLNRSILDASWNLFFNLLTYKAEEAGKYTVPVDPKGTSQMCICGFSVPKTLKDRVHNCPSCGLIEDRDLVSAKLIKERGTRSAFKDFDIPWNQRN